MAHNRWLNLPKTLRRFVEDFERVLDGPSPERRIGLVLLGAALSWWVYVPIHELLHAAGCWLGGGEVQRLEISPLYGGTLLAKWFPFVAAGGDYAGRLSGFDTGGSDGVYALTVVLPYILTPVGFILLGWALRRGGAFLFGAATPLLFSPLISVTGDFLELGGLVVFHLWPGAGCAYRGFLSDDLFRLLGRLSALSRTPHWNASFALFGVCSQIVGVALAWGTFRCSAWFQGWTGTGDG